MIQQLALITYRHGQRMDSVRGLLDTAEYLGQIALQRTLVNVDGSLVDEFQHAKKEDRVKTTKKE